MLSLWHDYGKFLCTNKSKDSFEIRILPESVKIAILDILGDVVSQGII